MAVAAEEGVGALSMLGVGVSGRGMGRGFGCGLMDSLSGEVRGWSGVWMMGWDRCVSLRVGAVSGSHILWYGRSFVLDEGLGKDPIDSAWMVKRLTLEN